MDLFHLRSLSGHLFVALPPKISQILLSDCPTFAEEANKSRHQLSLLMAGLKEQGISSVLFDFFGTGESEGSFEQSSVASYLADFQTVFEWCSKKYQQVSVLGIRLGALLSLCRCRAIQFTGSKWVAWQPQFNGKQVLNQFSVSESQGKWLLGKSDFI